METKIIVKIKTMDNQMTQFEIDQTITIAQFKQIIADKLNIPQDKQRLIFQGKQLENGKTLADYKIQQDHVIHLPGFPITPPETNVQPTQQQDVETFDVDLLSNILRTLRNHQFNRQNIRRMLQQQRSQGFNFDRQLSLEGIRQNYITIKSLIDTQTNLEEINQEDLQNEYINPFDIRKRQFQVGQWIDVKDTIDQWLEAQVVTIEQNKIFVHYNGWGNRWDEWIDNDSNRIATFRTYTVGGVNQDFLSPNPINEPDCDIEKQEIDMNKFIYDVGHMMNQVTKMLIEFGKYSNQKIISEKQLQLYKDQYQLKQSNNNQQSIIKNTEKIIKQQQINSSIIGSQLAPIFDRMGRMMVDMAPHLAQMGKQTQSDGQNQFQFQVPVTLTPNEIYQSQVNAPTLHSRLEIVTSRLAILRMTELNNPHLSDDETN